MHPRGSFASSPTALPPASTSPSPVLIAPPPRPPFPPPCPAVRYDAVPYKVLRFLFTEINYGGRVTDDKDRRLINNLIDTFCGPQLLEVRVRPLASARGRCCGGGGR